jgi:hypothetical protein
LLKNRKLKNQLNLKEFIEYIIKMKRSLRYQLIKFLPFLLLLLSVTSNAQTTPDWDPKLTPGGANSAFFRFTKQVWLNPSIILMKQRFEQETHVKLLILPRLTNTDTSARKLEKAFDMVLSYLVYKETEGSIKFYFDPKNTGKPFSFGTSDEIKCKFTPLQKDTILQLLNTPLAGSTNLDNFSALPFDSILNQASRYCKAILLSHPGSCGPDTETEFSLSKLNCVPARLSFEKIERNAGLATGGVDEQKYPSLAQYYNTVIDLSDKSNYAVAWKAVAVTQNDVIRIKITKKEKDFDFSKLVFKNASGTETYNTGFDKSDSTIITLAISGKSAGSTIEVVANYTNAEKQTYAIGAFNIHFYDPKPLTVVLWDVNGKSVDGATIQAELNKIYGNVFIKWTVKVVDSTIKLAETINRTIHVEGSGLLSNYMDDMQPINSYLRNNCSDYDSKAGDKFYIILGCKNDNNLSGYMPRARNIGFAFNTDAHTIAHELGHGAFGLKHIFCSEELGEGYMYQTDNLMDYPGEGSTAAAQQNTLYKHQWDLIHDPDFVGWFEGDDEEAELGNRMWFTPDWKLFTLGKMTRRINPDFSSGKIPKGTIPGVVLNGVSYSATFADGKFTGYKHGEDVLPIEYKTIHDTAKCCIYYFNSCEKSLFYTVRYKYVKKHSSGDFSMTGIPFIRKDKIECVTATPSTTTIVVNKSGVPYSSKELELLLNGGKKFKSENNSTYQSKIAKLFLTSSKTSDPDYEYIKKQCDIKDDTLRLWLSYAKDSTWVIEKGIDQYKFDQTLSFFGLKSSKTFNEIVKLTGKGVEEIAGLLYTLGDWLSKVDGLKVPPEWWNCNDAVYKPPFLIKVLTIAMDPVAVIMRPIINEVDPTILGKIEENAKLEQMNFALYAGLWDGMIGMISGVAQGVKLTTMNLATANADAVAQSTKMHRLISENGGGIGGFGRLMWDGIKEDFDLEKPCVFAHTVGEFTFGIIVGILTGGEAIAGTAVGRAVRASVQVLDKLDIIGQVVSKTAGYALKITYKAGQPVFKVLYKGVKVLPEFFKVPSGKLYSSIIPLPQLNLKRGIEAFKKAMDEGEIKIEPAADKNGVPILTENGEQLYSVKTKDNEEVFLIKGEEVLLSDLEKYLSQQGKIQESMMNLKASKLADKFAGASEIEAASIHRYTVSSFEMNGKLNRGLPLSEFETKWLESIHDGLAKMRQSKGYSGYVYRGQTLDEALVLQKYVEPFNKAKATNAPALVEEKALLSCTKSDEVANFFVELSKKKIKEAQSGVSVKFRTKSKRGVDIDDISDYGKFLCDKNPRCQAIQQEILLENGTFKINDIKVTNENGVKHYDITLEEF